MKTVVQDAIEYGAASACALVIDITASFISVRYLAWWYVAVASASFLGVRYLPAKCGTAAFAFFGIFSHAASYFSSNSTRIECYRHAVHR
jgi:hypothetical protein